MSSCTGTTGINWDNFQQTERVVIVPRLDFWVHSSLSSKAPSDHKTMSSMLNNSVDVC